MNQTEENTLQEEQSSYTPASPVKRALAWIGIVYMVIIVALTTYIYATGTPLNNLAPLLSIPAVVERGIVSVKSYYFLTSRIILINHFYSYCTISLSFHFCFCHRFFNLTSTSSYTTC